MAVVLETLEDMNALHADNGGGFEDEAEFQLAGSSEVQSSVQITGGRKPATELCQVMEKYGLSVYWPLSFSQPPH